MLAAPQTKKWTLSSHMRVRNTWEVRMATSLLGTKPQWELSEAPCEKEASLDFFLPRKAAGKKHQGLGTRLAAPGAQDRSNLSSDCPPPHPSSNPTSSPGIPPSLPEHCPCRNCQSPMVPGCWRVSFSACRATVRSSPRTSIPRDTSRTFRTRTETCNRRLVSWVPSCQLRAHPLQKRK